LKFADRAHKTWRLTITDLTWRYFCDSQRRVNKSRQKLESELTALLTSSQVYLRIGLARGWEKYPERCYLQITGVYTFPDYAPERTFADFLPR
jgi:hypothetical protein